MGTTRNFWASRVADQDRRATRCPEHPPLGRRQWNGRLTAAMFGFLAAVSAGPVLSTRADAQNSPPKNEEQERPAPPVAPPGDPPKGATQTPPPVAPPGDTAKGQTPAPPLDAPTGELAAPSDLQKKAAPVPDAAQEAAEAQALSLRYHFVELYGIAADPTRPSLLTQYRVATRDTRKMMREKQQGAPERSEENWQIIYTERVAQVNRLGLATDTVRRYDTVRNKNAARAPVMNPPLLQDLTILYRGRPTEKPEILSMNRDRQLREAEYVEISGEMFVPRLASLLPRVPVRVEDTWEVTRDAIRPLLRDLNDSKEFELTGTLIRVSKEASGSSLTAVIGIQGQFWVMDSPSAFNSQIVFTFELPKPDPVAAEKSKTAGAARASTQKGVVEARGWIKRALMSQVMVSLIEDDNSRLKNTLTRELDLERRLMAADPDAAAGPVKPLEVPSPLPAADETNSWLLFADPLGRFEFRHPQELEPRSVGVLGVELVNSRPLGGHDVLCVLLKPKGEDPNGNEAFRDPAQLERMLVDQWKASKVEATRGPVGWLNREQWAPRKVYRIESAVNTPENERGDSKRIYTDDYLVTLSPARSVVFKSMTERLDHVEFRSQVESMIKSFQFTPEKRASATPSSPTSTPPRP
jgi:hypothetical protein